MKERYLTYGPNASKFVNGHEPAVIISPISMGAQSIVGESLTLKVRNSPDAIAPASAKAEAWLEQHQSSPQALNLVLLAIEELVTNCIKYGYDDGGDHTITVVLSKTASLAVNVIDLAAHSTLSPRLGRTYVSQVEDRSIGGLGLHLLRHLADHMTY